MLFFLHFLINPGWFATGFLPKKLNWLSYNILLPNTNFYSVAWTPPLALATNEGLLFTMCSLSETLLVPKYWFSWPYKCHHSLETLNYFSIKRNHAFRQRWFMTRYLSFIAKAVQGDFAYFGPFPLHLEYLTWLRTILQTMLLCYTFFIVMFWPSREQLTSIHSPAVLKPISRLDWDVWSITLNKSALVLKSIFTSSFISSH